MSEQSIEFLKKHLEKSSVQHIIGWEIYWEEKQKQSFQSKENAIELVEEALEQGIAIRLWQGSRRAFSCTSDLSPKGLEKLVALTIEALPLLGEELQLPPPVKASSFASRTTSASVSREEKIEATLLLEKSARDFDRRITKVRDVRLEEEFKKIRLMTSEGFDSSYEDILYEMSLMVVAESDHGQEMAWESDFSHGFNELNPNLLGQSVAEKSVQLLGAQKIPTQKTAAVLDPIVTSAFLNVLAQSFCADQVYKGRSFLKGKMGSHAYAPSVTLLEDPLDEKSYDRAPFDAEGIATQKVVLVEKGKIKSWMTDLQMAQLLGCPATGHAVRTSYKESPHIGPRRFRLEPGRFSTEELIGEMGKGFFVQDIIGAHTIDAISGDFSVGATGLWIEGGKRRSAVRGVTISGNLHDIFQKIDKVGSQTREYQSFGASSLLIRSLDVSGDVVD